MNKTHIATHLFGDERNDSTAPHTDSIHDEGVSVLEGRFAENMLGRLEGIGVGTHRAELERMPKAASLQLVQIRQTRCAAQDVLGGRAVDDCGDHV